MSGMTTRDRAIDVLTTHRHGETKDACTYCADFYGDILDRLTAAGVLIDAATLADEIEQAPAETWGQPLHPGDSPSHGFYNGANSAIRFVVGRLRSIAEQEVSA